MWTNISIMDGLLKGERKCLGPKTEDGDLLDFDMGGGEFIKKEYTKKSNTSKPIAPRRRSKKLRSSNKCHGRQ